MSRILVLNAGSSSLKYEVVDLAAPDQRVGGIVERIGEPGSGASDHTEMHRWMPWATASCTAARVSSGRP